MKDEKVLAIMVCVEDCCYNIHVEASRCFLWSWFSSFTLSFWGASYVSRFAQHTSLPPNHLVDLIKLLTFKNYCST